MTSIGREKWHSDCDVNVVVVKQRAHRRFHSDRPGHLLAFAIVPRRRSRSSVTLWAWHHLAPLGSIRGSPIHRPPCQSEGIGNKWIHGILSTGSMAPSCDPTVFTFLPPSGHGRILADVCESWSSSAPFTQYACFSCTRAGQLAMGYLEGFHPHPAGFSSRAS